MFETNNIPAFFLSKDVVLSTFATGRTSGVVVDAGASGTVVVPVQDGWADLKGLNRSVVGGRYLDAYMLRILKKQGIQLRPAYRIKKTVGPDYSVVVSDLSFGRSVDPSYEAWACLEIGRDLKESVCRTSEAAVLDGDSRYTNMPLIPYELPDGTHVDVGHERFQPAELFFDPAALDLADPLLSALGMNVMDPGGAGVNNVFSSVESLPRLVVDSILRSENTDAQAALCGNIVVTGGSSCLDGLSERLKAEVEAIVFHSAPSWKVRTITTGAAERSVCAWLGGSILASLGTFHETWVARSEYDEYGPNIIDRKCP
jgi:actin-like protein 6A